MARQKSDRKARSVIRTYLASPYSDPDASVRARRYYYAATALAGLYRDDPGEYHFSPIVHSHPLALLGVDVDWLALDMKMLAISRRLVVLRIDGWDRSIGVATEIAEARLLGIPVKEIDG